MYVAFLCFVQKAQGGGCKSLGAFGFWHHVCMIVCMIKAQTEGCPRGVSLCATTTVNCSCILPFSLHRSPLFTYEMPPRTITYLVVVKSAMYIHTYTENIVRR